MDTPRDDALLVTATREVPVLAVRGELVERRQDRLAGEEPLQIRGAGPGQAPLDIAITMRTPGDEDELAAGFLVTEGIASPADLAAARFTFGDPAAMAQPHDDVLVHLPRALDPTAIAARTTVATASCGICGKASIDEVAMRCAPLGPGPVVGRSWLVGLPRVMHEAQAVFHRTGGLHAALLADPEGGASRLREDVGRHNALDKLIGASVLAGELPLAAHTVLVSGRISFELVQKAAMAGVPILAAVSAPTDLAVATAERLGMTLVGFLRGDGFNVYAGVGRIDLAR